MLKIYIYNLFWLVERFEIFYHVIRGDGWFKIQAQAGGLKLAYLTPKQINDRRNYMIL